jgi:hypothetical protein
MEHLKIHPSTILTPGVSYYLVIPPTCIRDAAGDYFAGFPDSTGWWFTVRSEDDPIVDSIVSLIPAGLYKMRDTITFAIHFSHPITLSTGKLNVVLETGEIEQTVSTSPFSSRSSITMDYIVQYGDHTDTLNVARLYPDPGATLKSALGNDLILTLDQGRNLSDHTVLRLDGILPDVRDLRPLANATELSPFVSYVLEEDVVSGSVSWGNAYLGDVPLADSIRLDSVLSDSHLMTGAHHIIWPWHGLVPGARYSVTVSVTDMAGNVKKITNDLVKLAGGITGLRVEPSDTSVLLGGLVQFRAMGLDNSGGTSSEVKLDSVGWSAFGSGDINQEGIFQALGLGECLVTARYDSLRDTALVTVDSGSVVLRPGGGDTLSIGRDIELQVPLLSDTLLSTVLGVRFIEEEQHPPGFIRTGPAVVFYGEGGAQWSAGESVVLRLQIDASLVGSGEVDRVQVYRRDPVGGSWIWVPSGREADNWLRVTAESLGTFFVGLDTKAPSVVWLSPRQEGTVNGPIGFTFRASDNITNPEVRLRVHTGGAVADELFPLSYSADGQVFDTVPGSLVTERGLWYTVEVWDGANLVAADTVDVKVKLEGLSLPADIVLPEGVYNMVSVPLAPLEDRVEGLFYNDWGDYDQERWRLFDYEETFIELDGESRIVPGRSYWVRTRGFSPRITLPEAATLPVSRAWPVALSAGWNSIANPFLFNVDANGLTLADGGGVQYLYSYEDGLWKTRELLEELVPWKGYLTWNGPSDSSVSDSVWIAPLAFRGVTGKAGAGKGYFVSLQVCGEGSRDGQAVFGYGYAGSVAGRDARDHMKPCMFRKPLELEVSVSWNEETPYLTDYRGALGAGQSWRFRVRNAAGGRVQLVFDGLQGLPEEVQAVLLDESRGAVRGLSSSVVEYASLGPTAEEFVLLMGSAEYLAERIEPFRVRHRVFSLEQNFPNPFDVATSISYTLPSTGGALWPVRLEVFDMQGRLVAELVDRRQQPGAYTVRWAGTGVEGGRLSAGTYVYRLRAGERLNAVRKMILLR